MSVPPPEAPDVPQLDKTYLSARAQLETQGFAPVKASAEPVKVCANPTAGATDAKCQPDTPLPEVQGCAGTCGRFLHEPSLAPDKTRVLKITTTGEPQPGKVYFKEWATSRDLKALPSDWKPLQADRSTPRESGDPRFVVCVH